MCGVWCVKYGEPLAFGGASRRGYDVSELSERVTLHWGATCVVGSTGHPLVGESSAGERGPWSG